MKTKFLEETLDAMRAFKCRNEEGKALLAVGKVLVKVRRAVQRVLEGGAMDPLKDALAAAATLEAMASGGAVEQVAMRAAYTVVADEVGLCAEELKYRSVMKVCYYIFQSIFSLCSV
jgi:hypothetical protein